MNVDEWGVPVAQRTVAEALRMRMDAAEHFGTVPEGLVVSQLGYPIIPEGQQAGASGRWIPATVSRETVAHPAWWLETSARLRWVGDDDDDYAGRIHWDLRAREVSRNDGLVDVLWRDLGIDIHRDEGWERVRTWLVGGTDDELSALRVPREGGGPEAAAEKAGLCRPELEERLRVRTQREIESIAQRAADGATKFRGSTAEGLVEPLVDAVKGGDRERVTIAAWGVQETLRIAHLWLVVLTTEALDEPAPPEPTAMCDEIGNLLAAWLEASRRRDHHRAGDRLIQGCLARANRMIQDGVGAAARLEACEVGPAPSPPAGLTVDRLYGPPNSEVR